MTDKEVERLIKRLMAFLRDMHVELKAQQRVLLGLELTPAEVQQRIRNVKKTFPTIKTRMPVSS